MYKQQKINNNLNTKLPFKLSSNFFCQPSDQVVWDHIFSCVQPFYDWAVSNKDRSIIDLYGSGLVTALS